MTSTTDKEWLIEFIRDYLPVFPKEIQLQLFENLPNEYLIDFLWYFESIRDLLLCHFSSQKLCFEFDTAVFRDEPFWGSCDEDEELVRFVETRQIIRGMYILTKIIPKKLVIRSCRDDYFNDIQNVLMLECIEEIPELEIVLEHCEISNEEVYFLISLPNLTKLQLFCVEFDSIEPEPREDRLALKNHKKLTEIAWAITAWVYDWSGIEFPQGLTSLALWNFEDKDNSIDSSTLIIPDSVQRLQIGGCDSSFEELSHKLPPHLEMLRLNGGTLSTIRVDELPRDLEILSISLSKLEKILGETWPPNINDISLHWNDLGDDGFQVIIDRLGWPENLTELDIRDNRTSRIGLLESFPPGLEILYIACNPFSWPDDQVFEFPCNLKELCMSACQFKDLKYIKLPLSLQELDISRNQISNILSYDDWSSLTNLRILNISSNSITSFDNWEIPPNVIKLNLSGNSIGRITSKFPLFNPKYNFQVERLVLGNCNLTTWEMDYLPPSLKTLGLSDNKFPKKFMFPSIFKQLNVLDLSDNGLTSIVFDEGDNTESCLHRLNLDGNCILGKCPSEESKDEFYDILEKNLGKLEERYYFVNSDHDFER